MKSFILVIFLTLTMFGGELKWETDLQTAMAKSKESGKSLMVLVESTHCRWCHKMKQETLSNPKIIHRLQDFVLVKVLKNETHSTIIPETKLVPTIYFYDSNLEPLEEAIGYWDDYDFNSWIDDALNAMKKKNKS